MDLILWRHAEAQDDSLDDLARELTSKGHKQAKAMAAWLNARLPVVCRVVSSPAVRAQQTAEALMREVHTDKRLSPGANVEDMLAAVNSPNTNYECVLLVGHQPDLGALAAMLLGSAESLSIQKGAVWWFSTPNKTADRGFVLRAVVSPKMLNGESH